MRNLLIGVALVVWFVLVIGCTLTKQWPLVVALFAAAWLIENIYTTCCEEE
jgi:hypothetical protein